MGQAYACGKKMGRSKHDPVYKTILARIFNFAPVGAKVGKRHAVQKHINRYTETPAQGPGSIDIPKLEAHVASHMKGLIDYLESNHNKLVDTGNSVAKTVTKSSNPEIHIMGLIILRDLLKEIKRFTYDSGLVCKLIGVPSSDDAALTNDDKKIACRNTARGSDIEQETGPDMVAYNTDIMGNIKQFEGAVLEVLWFIYDRKRNSLYSPTYKYTLQVLSAYARNHIGWMPTERIEYLVTESLETINHHNRLDNKESLELNCCLLDTIINLSKIPNVLFSFKFAFIQYTCKLLRDIYHNYGNKTISDSVIVGMSEVAQLREQARRKSFEALTVIVQHLSDLSEFDALIVPIFSFFDSTLWIDEELQQDIFISFIRSLRDHNSFDQIELFLIEKIVEYIDYSYVPNPINQKTLYQNNKVREVKIRAFSSLEAILNEVRSTFLSFLVVDKLVRCFINNLQTKEVVIAHDKDLKDSIYDCQKIFLGKISNSSRSLAQLINSVVTQIFQKHQENVSNESQVIELLKFLEFSIGYINSFPSQIYILRNSLLMLLKLREMTSFTFSAFPVIEKLLNLTYDSEASPNDKRAQKGLLFLPVEGDVVYTMLASNLETLKNFVESRRAITAEAQIAKDVTLLGFLLHCTRINDNLLLRKDNALLPFQVAFIKKIMGLSQAELKNYESKQNIHSKESSGILLYSVFHFVKSLANKWELTGMQPYVQGLAQRIPHEVVNVIEAPKSTLSKEEVDQIYKRFNSFDFPDSNWYDEEYAVFLDLIVNQLQNMSSSIELVDLTKEFEELDPAYNPGQAMLPGEETLHTQPSTFGFERKPSISPVQPSSLDDVRLKMKRKESLAIFDKVNVNLLRAASTISQKTTQGTNGINEGESEESSLMDSSFRKAMKDAKFQKENLAEVNLMKILEEETY